MLRFSLTAVCALALGLTGCTSNRGREAFFGDTRLLAAQALAFDNGVEPSSIDPAKALSISDVTIVGTLFEGLVQNNPITAEPMAALATHYQVSPDGMEYVFYLRGHASPRGVRLKDSDSLPSDYSHGARVPPDSIPARWSDRTIITAHDFVYSWRRVADPRTAASNPDYMSVVKNATAILSGKRSPQDLGVAAEDDYTLRIKLEEPAPYLLSLVAHPTFRPVSMQAEEKALREGHENDWWHSAAVVTSGPFHLAEWRPYDEVRVHRSTTYYQSSLVRLEDVTFLPISADSAVANLYRAGASQSILVGILPEVLVPALLPRRDFHSDFTLGVEAYSINTHRPPFDNVLLRYALNMSIDKAAVAAFLNAPPAKTLMAGVGGYEGPDSLLVGIGGRQYDVLAYNPVAAQQLLALAGYPDGIGRDGQRLAFDLRLWSARNYVNVAEIVARYWLKNLHIQVRLSPAEFAVGVAEMRAGQFSVISDSWLADFYDPLAMLTPSFVTGGSGGWTDGEYVSILNDANRTFDRVLRFKKLARAEARLLHEMPIIPLAFAQSHTLLKPYVRALQPDPVSNYNFRYTWIDTGWKP